MGDVFKTSSGYDLPFEFFIGLGCDGVNEAIRTSSNITELYLDLLLQVENTTSKLWQSKELGGCYGPMCQATHGGGNPDISGIGLVVAYALEVSLAFVLSTLVLWNWRIQRYPREIDPKAHAKTHGLVQSLAVFVDTALFFALAIVLATSLLTSNRYRHAIGISTYDLVQALLSSTITVAPCLAALYTLQCCGQKIGRRMCILALACLINVFAIIVPFIILIVNKGGGMNWGIADDNLELIAGAPATFNPYDLNGKKNGDNFDRVCYTFFSWSPGILVLFILGIILGIAGQIVMLGFVFLFGLRILKHRMSAFIRRIRESKNANDGRPKLKPTYSDRRTMTRDPRREEKEYEKKMKKIEKLRKKGKPVEGIMEERPQPARTQSEEERLQKLEEERLYQARPIVLELFAFVFCPLALSIWSGSALLAIRIMLIKSWNNEDEGKWGFGQIVGVLMFLPVLVEFPYEWITNYREKQRELAAEAKAAKAASSNDPESGKSSSESTGKHAGATYHESKKTTANEGGVITTKEVVPTPATEFPPNIRDTDAISAAAIDDKP